MVACGNFGNSVGEQTRFIRQIYNTGSVFAGYYVEILFLVDPYVHMTHLFFMLCANISQIHFILFLCIFRCRCSGCGGIFASKTIRQRRGVERQPQSHSRKNSDYSTRLIRVHTALPTHTHSTYEFYLSNGEQYDILPCTAKKIYEQLLLLY